MYAYLAPAIFYTQACLFLHSCKAAAGRRATTRSHHRDRSRRAGFAHLSALLVRDPQLPVQLLLQGFDPHQLVLRLPHELSPLGVYPLGALGELEPAGLYLLELLALSGGTACVVRRVAEEGGWVSRVLLQAGEPAVCRTEQVACGLAWAHLVWCRAATAVLDLGNPGFRLARRSFHREVPIVLKLHPDGTTKGVCLPVSVHPICTPASYDT